MCVNTIVLSSPIFRATTGAMSCENADNSPAQKKNTPACASERPNRSKSQSVISEFTTSPPANASTLKSAASLKTIAARRAEGRRFPHGGAVAAAAGGDREPR